MLSSCPQADLLRAYENEKKSLEAEIAGYKASLAKHDKTIQVLKKVPGFFNSDNYWDEYARRRLVGC